MVAVLTFTPAPQSLPGSLSNRKRKDPREEAVRGLAFDHFIQLISSCSSMSVVVVVVFLLCRPRD